MPAKAIILKIITAYQRIFSPDTGVFASRQNTCVFYPSCSEYTKEAIIKYGIAKGLFKGAVRIAQCHPWQKQTNDPLR